MQALAGYQQRVELKPSQPLADTQGVGMASATRATEIIIRLNISAEQFQRHYRGVPNVEATAIDGRSVVLPASALRAHVTRDGVHGLFAFRISAAGKLLSVERRA